MVDRQSRLDEIKALAASLEVASAADDARAAREAQRERVDAQIIRLEEAALKLRRRLLEIDAAITSEAEVEVFAPERDLLQARAAQLEAKRAELEASVATDDLAASHRVPPGVPARLRALLRDEVREVRADPTQHPSDWRPLQARIVALVQDRREALRATSATLVDARNRVLAASHKLEALLATAGSASSPLPFADEREAIAVIVDAAAAATRAAHRRLRATAHGWPEMMPLADRPDWDHLPFGQLSLELRAAERPTQSLASTLPTLQALALWVGELADAVEAVPPPT
ncbi:MAG: hypothetical protein H6698_08120 [Myxococcales bacterium]|nr:hypothetical protein [Myxococcales bacterium]MCB9534254.1 hypothetical protein [Myxococcales bacterium]